MPPSRSVAAATMALTDPSDPVSHWDWENPVAELCGSRVKLSLAASNDRNVRTLFDEHPGDLLADATRSAGDDCAAAL